MFSAPILTYHKISEQKEFGLTTISPLKFKSQLDILIKYKYNFKIFKNIDAQVPEEQHQVILTFDDGYECIYHHAFPLMRELKITGVIFLISDYINKKNDWESYSIQRKHTHMTKDQIIDMHRAGFEFGSHGRRHLYLNNKPDKIIITEISDSKKRIEDLIGDEVVTFCYPFGQFNQRIVQLVKQAGYKYALGSANLFHYRRNDQLQLCRRTIYSSDSEQGFLNKIAADHNHLGSFLKEWIIQHGTWLNIIKQNFNEYK